MSAKHATNAEDLMAATAALGLHAEWAWTGGNCRAVLVQATPLVTYPQVLITHEDGPFTDDDLLDDLTGQNLAMGLYSAADDDEPSILVAAASDSSRIAEIAATLLTRQEA